MSRGLRRRGLTVLLAIGWLATVLACNYPTALETGNSPESMHLRQTLEALNSSDPRAGASGLSTQTPQTDADRPAGGQTATPASTIPGVYPWPTLDRSGSHLTYLAQAGDTLPAVASRFEVKPSQISSPDELPATGYLHPGQPLIIPDNLPDFPNLTPLLPDSEVIYSPSTVGFDISVYVQEAGGFLADYRENIDGGQVTGVEIIERVAAERSSNPRMLLAFLEHRSQWVLGQPPDPKRIRYPIGFYAPGYTGLYKELTLVANHLNIAFYDWRIGNLATLRLKDGSLVRLNPGLNAGSVAVQNLFSKFYDWGSWEEVLYGEANFSRLYERMFGDPWKRAATIEPYLHSGVTQPVLELPFLPGERWSFTGGPHKILNLGSPLGALDFSPVTGQGECAVSSAWVTASAGGVVTRSGDAVVVVDLDGDGFEQTGWVLFYLHVAERERVAAGSQVKTDDLLGHPSCEGGTATGTHVHIARKFQGEWIAADGPLPFTLSGWQVKAGERAYEGQLTNGDQVVVANPSGPQTSLIVR